MNRWQAPHASVAAIWLTMTAPRFFVFLLLVAAVIGSGYTASGDPMLQQDSGGETTTPLRNRNAFGSAAANLTTEEHRRFEIGDSFFTEDWVTAPASTDARDGLGPLMNAVSCSSCHVLDGRAAPPEDNDDPERGLLLRIGVFEGDEVVVHPVYGGQLQDRAIAGVQVEGVMGITYTEMPGSYEDGTAYSLRSPQYSIEMQGYGDIAASLLISPRIAPVVSGMGLIEAIPEAAILANVDENDEDGDGISGRANFVTSVATGGTMLGRIGWKANVATIEDQVAAAFLRDIGITSSVHPDENCTATQAECLAAVSGGNPELTAKRLAEVVFYSSTLAVPARRDLDEPDVQAGARLFEQLNCSGCHTPTFTTGSHDIAAISDQTIFPFSDFLLHDMGPDLADGKPDGLASGSEWRTPPLWGIGLIETVNGHTNVLHDGRARSIYEAILWHGGEAEDGKTAFTVLDSDDRDRLIAFVESL